MRHKLLPIEDVRFCLAVIGLLVANTLSAIGTATRAAEPEAPATAAEKLPPAVQWLEPQTLAVLEISQPKPLLEALLAPQTTGAIAEQPLYKRLAAEPQFKQFVQLVRLLEMTCGTDWRSGVQKLLGGGVVASVDSSGGVVIVIDSEDQKLLENLHRVLLELAKGEAVRQGQPEPVRSKDYRGVTAWTLGGTEAHAVIGRRLVLTNRSESLRKVLDLRAEPDASSLSTQPWYQAARRATGGALATVCVNTSLTRDAPNMRQAVEQLADPWLALLLPGAADVVARSDWLALSLRADGRRLILTALAEKAEAAKAVPFARPQKPGEGPLPLLRVPGQIAGATLYRDLHQFYAAKDELFPQRTSGLIFFENMMGIFFSGRELTEEVLKEFRPEIRMVVAQQQYDPKIGVPEPQIPAFAAVLRLRNATAFSEVVEEAWQKAFGLVSFTRGQKAEPGLILDRLTHRGVKFTVAYFSARGQTGKSPADVRFNFRPALAMPGDWVILSSTEQLARELIDALLEPDDAAAAQKPQATRPAPASPTTSAATAGANTVVELDAPKLAELLRSNRETLVRQEIIEKAKTRAEAEAEQELVTFLLSCAGQVRLALGGAEKHTLATLEMTPALPKTAGQPAAK